MTRRAEVRSFPDWDGAKLRGFISPTALMVEHPRKTPKLEGVLHLREVRHLLGVAEEGRATLYGWSGYLRRWVPCAEGPVPDLRGFIRELRRASPDRAYWLRPDGGGL